MTVTYDPTDLDETTATGRLNVVRYLVGDTDVASAEVQDEEINFFLSKHSDSTYAAAASVASSLASKYAKLVTTKLDGALSSEYNELYNRYQTLATQLRLDDTKLNGRGLGIFIGGLPTDPNCTSYVFYRGQFSNPQDCDNRKLADV